MTLAVLEISFVLFLVIALLTIIVARWIAVPYPFGLVVVGLVLSLLGWLPEVHLTPSLVLFVFLPALLFEGAWSMRWELIRTQWRLILFLAGPGLFLSLGLLASLFHLLAGLDWGMAWLLAAILVPTDPVAVLSLLRQQRRDERLAVVLESESLFTVSVAGTLSQGFLATVPLSQASVGIQRVGEGLLFVGGGVVFGFLLGWLVSQILQRIDEPLTALTMTVAVAYGGYALADALPLSALLSVIVAALVLGNDGVCPPLEQRDPFTRNRRNTGDAWQSHLITDDLMRGAIPLLPDERQTALSPR